MVKQPIRVDPSSSLSLNKDTIIWPWSWK